MHTQIKLPLYAAALTAATSLLLLAGAAADPRAQSVAVARPAMAQPAPGHSFMDATFKHTVTRLSDSGRGPVASGRQVVKTDYSRIQAENADGSTLLVLAANDKGLLQYALMDSDGSDLRLINLPANPSGLRFLHDETEARWHPENPQIIRFIEGQNSYVGGLRVFEYHTERESVSVLADLSGKLPAHWGDELYGMTHHEGEYSDDGNRLAWAIETAEDHREETVGYVAFDLRDGGRVLGTLDYDGRDHDHLSISPSGEYVVISAAEKTSAHPVDFSAERVLLRETQHSDLCRTADGRDCYIAVSFDNSADPDYGWVFMVDLASGRRTRLLDVFGQGNTSLHLSGRGRPGWAALSTYNCSVGDSARDATRLCDRVSLLELKDSPRTIPLAWTRSSGKGYYAEPQASLNRDGSRVYFNSDWHKANKVDVYRIDIPASHYR